jgi:hypothetical protein
LKPELPVRRGFIRLNNLDHPDAFGAFVRPPAGVARDCMCRG